MLKKKASGRTKKVPVRKKVPEKKTNKKKLPFPIVAIGASLGGLKAISALLENLPVNTGMAYIYVQHLSPDHKSYLPSLLAKTTKMKVQEIDNMELMKPDNVYVIPYNKGIKVTDGHIQLIPRTKNSSAISIDVLFSSLAKTHRKNVVGILLSGNGHDGTIGIKAIKNAGGITIAQDKSAQAGSMPESAIKSGFVDFVLSPKGIGQKLTTIEENGIVIASIKGKRRNDDIEDNNLDLNSVLTLLNKNTGVDFTHYKMPTIKRRLKNRMLQSGTKTIKEYSKFLSGTKEELNLLYKDLLINVTSFFRDPDAFRYLAKNFLPKLLKNKNAGETLRVWIPACSTGQEAYSIAMLIEELQDKKIKKIPVKIFATDLSKKAIRTARLGEYLQRDISGISPSRLKRFFTKTGNQYLINKELRKMCVFAPHNILGDPPFLHMDFISCRNLLIYFDVLAQKKALATLHFALNDKGYLMLGKSETTGASSQLFTKLNNKFKICSRKNNTGTRKLPELTPRFSGTNHEENKTRIVSKKNTTVSTTELDSSIDTALLQNYMPACAIINKDMEILKFRGSTSLYLSHPSGNASLNILKMTRPEFVFELRNAILKVIKTKQTVSKSGIEIKIDSTFRTMTLEVSHLKMEGDEPSLLIVFTSEIKTDDYIENYTGGKKSEAARVGAKRDRVIKKMGDELSNARAEMHSVIESQETAYEELQAANEEIVSTNEEFQTLNEELETSKEEIESTNEELISSNEELKTQNELLAESYHYAEAITATIHEPMIILDSNLRVKSANKSFYKKFLVKKEETEGNFLFELGNKQWEIPKLRQLLQTVILKNIHFQNFEVTHVFPGLGEKVMLLNASRIIQKMHREKLILLAIEDITLKKIAEEKIKVSEKNYRSLIQSLPIALYTCDKNGYVQSFNKAAADLWGREPKLGKEHWCGSWKLHRLDGSALELDKCPMALTLKEERAISGEEIIIERPDGSKRNVLPHPQPVFDELGKLTGAINTLIDITEIRRSQQYLKDSEKRYNMMLMKSPFAFSVLKGKDMIITLANDTMKELWGKGKQVEGKALLQVLPEIKHQQFPALLEKVFKTGTPFYGYEILAQLQHSSKTVDVYLNLVYQPYLEVDETISGVTVIAYDVTAQVTAKRETDEQHEKERDYQKKDIRNHEENKLELEKLVKRRTKQLEQQNIELEGANKELTTFTYVSSHDLQEPLRKIRNFTTILLDEERKKLSDDGKKYLQKTYETAKQMQSLIEDLLTYSRTKDIERLFEKTDLGIILDEVKKDLKEALQQKKATVKFSDLGEASIIRFQFKQLMYNLIGNSLKFASPETAPHILIKSSIKPGNKLNNENLNQKTNYCHIVYTDNGIGFDPQYNERVFEVFQRLHSKEEYQGTGMGLAICKRIVENHKGIITASGKLNKGVQFDIYIPV